MDTDIILQGIMDQVLEVFTSGTLNIMIVIGMTILTQIIKMNIKAISKRILLVPVVMSLGLTAFSFYVLKIEMAILPIVFFGYLGGSVLMYFLLKKFIPDFFKSNYEFINGKKKTKKKEK